MEWISDDPYSWIQKFSLNVIKSGGSIPRHVAFIMDGNRRYAKCEEMKTIDGHCSGFAKLGHCLRWCLDIGIKEVTLFAFSIENFKRPKDEVDSLFDLARQNFEKLLNETQKCPEHGVRIRVFGNITLFPKDLQDKIARAVLSTENYNNLFLNLAISYTSRDEITQAIEAVLQHGDMLHSSDINESLLEKCLYTNYSTEPDLLFRTSGETRISDFLMWQIHSTVVHFAKSLWPQFTFWEFLHGIFKYQRALLSLRDFNEHQRTERQNISITGQVQIFLHRLNVYRRNFMLKLASLK